MADTSIEQDMQKNLQKIHPELNLEKWNIFVPSSSRLDYLEVERTREITLQNGSKVQVKVRVQKVGRLGVLTTEDKKTCCALQKMWEDEGKPTHPVAFSCRKLAKILKKTWGVNTVKAITNSLTRLRTVPMIWDGAFFNADTNETEELLTAFTILSDLKIVTRRKDGHVTGENSYFCFNDYILKNLRANHTKPVYLDVILGFKSDIALLLYTHIDLILARTNPYSRYTEALFTELGLEGKTYCHASARKRKLEKAIEELKGVPLSTGILSSIRIEKSTHTQDYKVTFTKRPYPAANKPVVETDRVPYEPEDAPSSDMGACDDVPAAECDCGFQEEPPPSVEASPSTLHPITVGEAIDAAELVAYFHRKLSRPQHKPTRKELEQADALVGQHGSDLAAYIVNYALRAARQTNFAMRFFGAILQYQADALAAYDRKQHRQARRAAQPDVPDASAPVPAPVPAKQLDVLPDVEPPSQVDLQARFDALDADARARIIAAAEQKLASHKHRMTAAVYADTLNLVILQEMAAISSG